MQVQCLAGPSRLPRQRVLPVCICECFIRPSGTSRTFAKTARIRAREEGNTPSDASKDASKAFAKTLLLPKTDFPLRADAANREKLFRERMTEDLYKWQWNQKDRPLFVLHDGPPYANGNLHIGHALNKILKDVINRYKMSRGFRVNYIPGWDCHGLPIEHKALQQLEADHRDMTPLEVRKVAKKTADKAIAVQKKELQQFGLMCDWSKVYKTFNREYEVRQLRVFQEMVKRGQIFRAVKPVLWSPSSRTALAEAEISYKDDHVSESVYVRFPITKKGSRMEQLLDPLPWIDNNEQINLIVWTTTPWTLPANLFVSYAPKVGYTVARFESSGEAVIVATERLDHLRKITGQTLKPLVSFSGGDFFPGTTYCPPFQEWRLRDVAKTFLPLIPADYVTAESGTGLVHSAPAHGQEDYQTFRSGLPDADLSSLDSPVDEDGLFRSSYLGPADPYDLDRLKGKSVLGDGVQEVIKILKEREYLVATQKIRHKYPYDWKTKQPVIVRTTPQWFANLDKIKDQAIKALEHVNFVPIQGRNRLESFVRGRSEWCISRQRAWGVPIPVVYQVDSMNHETPLTTDTHIEHIISVLSEKGFNYWWEGSVEEFLPPDFAQQGHLQYRKGTDTMDVWLDSGVSWTGIDEALEKEGLEYRTPVADVYLEGSDQHRGWFQSSLLTSIAVSGKAPFANVITHGFVLDEKGVKMSKSVGNVISPLTVIKGGKDKAKEPALGADTLRFWAASAGYTREVNISFGILQASAEGLRKIRNTVRFILGNLANSGAAAQTEVPPQLSLVDRYILHELAVLSQTAEKAFDDFHFNRAMTALSNFCTTTLSSFYFEIIKDSLYADSLTTPRRRAIIYTLQQILPIITSISSPVVPHLAEDIWQHWPQKSASDNQSVFQHGWKSANSEWTDTTGANQMELLKSVRSEVMTLIEQARRDKHIGSSVEAEVDVALAGASTELRDALQENADLLHLLFVVSKVNLLEEEPEAAESQHAWSNAAKMEKDVQSGKLALRVHGSTLHKCPRCWLFTRHELEETCQRCSSVMH